MARKIKLNWDKIKSNIVEREKSKSFSKVDERLYQPKLNDDGTFQAVIRFLWSPDTDIPFVKKFSHGFQGPGGWYIEDCPTTVGNDCPACKANGVEWNKGTEAAQNLARQRARRLSVYSNILVLKDPQTPENEGKVFVYRYGKKIHDKIMEKINPGENSIEDPVMIFDPYDGANFKLIIRKVRVKGGKPQNNYDSSQFSEKTSLGDAQIENAEKNLYKLAEFSSAEKFKSYEELEMKFNKISGTRKEEVVQQRPEKRQEEKVEEEDTVPAPGVDEGDDDGFFKKLQQEKSSD